MSLFAQCIDIPRIVSVYHDRAGIRWWTKAWFNNREVGEPAVEITSALAIAFLAGDVDKNEWLEEHFPAQMKICHEAIDTVREQLLQQGV